ncbi:AAA family ATPase [Spirosoma taeanense]|uniref:AAA family ATPase n=1 Tax=Spirosoma taeanense TaxID=2735870 RepID=A0A6M5Y8Y1_9BACT|nr:AAA family ATPase [Spirosoma taeanense]QJW89691.1 AAA family ATPase [Spirosoma taeanense]
MKIKSLVIENFKSIERIELIEPNPFTVFVGPNGSGKSNIFEALEFVNLQERMGGITGSLFGGPENFLRRHNTASKFTVHFDSDVSGFERGYYINILQHSTNETAHLQEFGYINNSLTQSDYVAKNPFYNFSRLFVGKDEQQKLNFKDDNRLTFAADNLELVLKRILSNSILRNELFEWLELFVPEFKAVEIDDRNELHWFEQFSSSHFTKSLISDGTFNILALLTAVYQSDDKPQFLCIEEPENGLHPQVAAELVDFFRIMCEERGHYIWLNTHSQSMASRVRPNEFVVVEKKEGATTVRQFRNEDFHGMSVDEAWLTNALNGGLAW